MCLMIEIIANFIKVYNNFQICFTFVLSYNTKHDFYLDFREGAQYASLKNIAWRGDCPLPQIHCHAL